MAVDGVAVWTWVQNHWATLVLVAGYLPLIFELYKSRLELRKIKLEIADLQAKMDERERRIEKVSLADIAKYAPRGSAFDDIE